MRLLLPIPFVGLALGLTVSLGVASLVGVVRVLGSARHAGGFLFCWILTDFHCTTSFGSIIARYKIKIKIRSYSGRSWYLSAIASASSSALYSLSSIATALTSSSSFSPSKDFCQKIPTIGLMSLDTIIPSR